MNTTIDQLLTNVYELEGLLLVMQRHNDEVPQLVIDRFKEKANEIAAEANVLDNFAKKADTPQPEPVPPTFVPPTEQQTVAPTPIAPTTPQVQEPVTKSGITPEPTPKPVVESKPIVKAEPTVAPKNPTSHDITSAFSINDRFLFQRELFDGDKQKYSDAIAVMQRLANIDKIKEFISDVLGLDRSDEVVKEFVRLIELSLK